MGKLIRDTDKCAQQMPFINSKAGARLIFKYCFSEIVIYSSKWKQHVKETCDASHSHTNESPVFQFHTQSLKKLFNKLTWNGALWKPFLISLELLWLKGTHKERYPHLSWGQGRTKEPHMAKKTKKSWNVSSHVGYRGELSRLGMLWAIPASKKVVVFENAITLLIIIIITIIARSKIITWVMLMLFISQGQANGKYHLQGTHYRSWHMTE